MSIKLNGIGGANTSQHESSNGEGNEDCEKETNDETANGIIPKKRTTTHSDNI